MRTYFICPTRDHHTLEPDRRDSIQDKSVSFQPEHRRRNFLIQDSAWLKAKCHAQLKIDSINIVRAILMNEMNGPKEKW
jgi:hypothetical protein